MIEKDRAGRVHDTWARIEEACLELSGLLKPDELTINPIAWAESAGEERGRWWARLQALEAADDAECLAREIKALQAQLAEAMKKAKGG